MQDIELTIFTPTCNRATLLRRLYVSLCRQTNKSFEWLIVDDESGDGTEAVIFSFMEQTDSFAIRYYSSRMEENIA